MTIGTAFTNEILKIPQRNMVIYRGCPVLGFWVSGFHNPYKIQNGLCLS
jgi:hypothetical protein